MGISSGEPKCCTNMCRIRNPTTTNNCLHRLFLSATISIN